jgi:hypothetical protein
MSKKNLAYLEILNLGINQEANPPTGVIRILDYILIGFTVQFIVIYLFYFTLFTS